MRRIGQWLRKRSPVEWIIAALLVAIVLSCFYFHYEFQAKTGLWYRKKMLLYVSPGVVCLVFSMIRLKIPEKRNVFARVMFAGLCIALATDVFQRMAWDNPLVYGIKIKPKFVALNLSIVTVIFMAIWTLIWDSKKAGVVTFWLMYFLGYAYYCVGEFRGVSFRLTDIMTIATALEVAGNYRYPFTARQVFWAMFGVMLSLIGRWIPRQKSRHTVVKLAKLAGLMVAFLWMFFLVKTPFLISAGVRTSSFEPTAVYYNAEQGAICSLVKEAGDLQRIKPENYHVGDIREISPDLLIDGMTNEDGKRPNVLVVMNESLTDLQRLWQIDLQTDPMPFVHSLRGKSVWGNLYVSSLGGGTSNTEHSFLTSTIPSPNLSIPLINTVNDTTPSLAWQLKSLGYRTVAIHPEKPTNYQRDRFYPLLGMDTFLNIRDFEGVQTIHNQVSDRACYEKIISLYEEKAEDERLFVFNVTMQNHSGYEQGGIEKNIRILNDKGSPQLEEYFSCMYQSDRAFEELCCYFEKETEPTIILLFGDHQPSLDLSAFEMRSDLPEMAQRFVKYITPFVVWANYPIEAEYVPAISVNYLAALLLEKGGLPMTHYDQWILEISRMYPVVLQHGYANNDGQSWLWKDDAEWPKELCQLDILRYNRLHDVTNRLPALKRTEPKP